MTMGDITDSHDRRDALMLDDPIPTFEQSSWLAFDAVVRTRDPEVSDPRVLAACNHKHRWAMDAIDCAEKIIARRQRLIRKRRERNEP